MPDNPAPKFHIRHCFDQRGGEEDCTRQKNWHSFLYTHYCLGFVYSNVQQFGEVQVNSPLHPAYEVVADQENMVDFCAICLF
jgi:hypothetical protein